MHRGSIRPEAPGMAACFFHALIHDSEPLSADAPAKWIWRTEVMYRRDPETARPRINKLDSQADREQKASGDYFFVGDV